MMISILNFVGWQQRVKRFLSLYTMKADARRTVVVSRSLYTMIAAACRTSQR